jgi:hypothetical protein
MQTIPSEYLEIDRKARVYMPYQDLSRRSPTERVCDFGDVIIGSFALYSLPRPGSLHVGLPLP